MATNTAKLQLRKPVDADDVDVDLDLGENFDKLDAAVDRVVANEAARTALVAYQGMRVFQVDTKANYTWDGATWRADGEWYDATIQPFAAGSASLQNGSYVRNMRMGRLIHVHASLIINVGTPAGRVYFQGTGLPAPIIATGQGGVLATDYVIPAACVARYGSVSYEHPKTFLYRASEALWFLWNPSVGDISSGLNGGDFFKINCVYEASNSG